VSDRQIRYGELLKEVSVNHVTISYNELTPKGAQKRIEKIQLRRIDAYRLIQPYVSVRFIEQLKALLPLALYLAIFQLFILRQVIQDSFAIVAGLFAVIMGLMFFIEGIKQGLMPFGEEMGNTLPKKVTLKTVLTVAFLLGVGVTFAEPAIGALKTAGALVEVKRAPYLYILLTDYADALVLVVGGGVGIAAILGTVRFLYGFSLKPFIYITMIPIVLLSIYFQYHEPLSAVLGLAWDSGAVTTGPVTVPLVLALGIGIASAAGKGDSNLSGFGIVTLASLFPILGVMLLGIFLSFRLTPEEIIQGAAATTQISSTLSQWWNQSPWQEIILGLRAIVPLIAFLFLVMRCLLREKIKKAGTITYGIVLSVLGMCIFNIGLTYGLVKLGNQSGSLVPTAFCTVEQNGMFLNALYPYLVGLIVAIGFAFILGFGATLAEPALNALGMTVQNLTNGVFKKATLMYAVSVGVGTGIALGICKLIFGWSLAHLLIPLYLLALILTYFSSEEFVNIAWDSAGVTTGPVTVPLVLAMGLGFGSALNAVEGFGILSMASICPILSVLITGLWVRVTRHIKRSGVSLEAVP